MALIKCPECGRAVSSAAANCPQCGYPIQLPQPAPVGNAGGQRPPQPKWNKGVAALLSLIIPGAGQMYKGQVGNGLVWLVFVVIVYAAFNALGLILHLLCIFGAASGDPYK